MKTYLILWHSSEGSNPLDVMQQLTGLGFEPVKGYYDLMYDHGSKDVTIQDIMDLAIIVHETLKGSKVLYKLETPDMDE